MKNKLFILIIAAVVLLTACEDTKIVHVKKVELNKETLTLRTGQSETLVADVKPDNATNKRITWESSNKNVVTVNENGTVNAIAAGSAIITLISEDRKKQATCTITVGTPSVSVGTQVGTLIAGQAGTVTFPITTAHIANGNYIATVATLPTGVTVQGQVTISNNAGTLTLAGSTSTIAGTYSTLRVTISDVESESFTLTINPKVISVDTQNGILTAGLGGKVTFLVTSTHILNGGPYTATVTNLPNGVTVQGNITFNNYTGTLTLAGSTSIVAGTYNTLRLTIDGVQSAPFTLTISPPAPKNVLVGTQSGTLIAGVAGTVTFPVTTENIANGNYTATVTNRPTGVTVQGQVTISNDVGTLTLAGSTSTISGTTNTLQLTIDGTQSSMFTMTISPPAQKTVSVGTQNGTLIAGVAGTVTFPVTTENIANGSYTATVSNRPTGVTVQGQVTISNNVGTLILAGSTSTIAGTTNTLQLTIDGTQSTLFMLVIIPKTVSVGEQSGTLITGVAGTVTFPVTTSNIANGSYTATVSNRPTGITIQGQVTISNNVGTLTLAGNIFTIAGTTSTLRLTIDGTQSLPFTLTISPPAPKTVSVGAQSGTLTAGVAGSVTFPVTTANITNGSYTATVTNRPTGVSVQGQVTINNNLGTLTLAGSTLTIAGTTNTLQLTIDGTQSSFFSLTINSAGTKNVSVGTQNGVLTAGVAGTVTFPVTTSNIANGNYTATVINRPSGITVQGQVTISNNAGTLTLAGNTFTVASTNNTLQLTIDGTQSLMFTLTISPAARVRFRKETTDEWITIMEIRDADDNKLATYTFGTGSGTSLYFPIPPGNHIAWFYDNHPSYRGWYYLVWDHGPNHNFIADRRYTFVISDGDDDFIYDVIDDDASSTSINSLSTKSLNNQETHGTKKPRTSRTIVRQRTNVK